MSSTPWGVDLSPTYNPTVDAKAIAAAGASYAILKVSEGVGWPDEQHNPAEFDWFARVAADVLDAGLELRVYHLATPSDRADALAEATWFDRHLGSVLPASVSYDLERLVPDLSAPLHVAIFEAWRDSIAAFLPTVPIDLYCNRSVFAYLAPFLPASQLVWLAWPNWPGNELPPVVDRVQIGQRVFPTMPDHPVDVDVSPNATNGDVIEALGLAAPKAPTTPAPKTPTPQANSDWSLTVRTLDLRNAATTLVTGDSVKSLQTLLNLADPQHPIKVDGEGGPATLGALRLFQMLHHLTVDGIAGPQTWEALCRQ